MRDSSIASTMKIPIRPTLGVQRRKTWRFLPLLVLAVSCIGGTLWPMAGTASAQSDKPSKQTPGETDVQRLVGRWVRPDGGYILDLGEIHEGS